MRSLRRYYWLTRTSISARRRMLRYDVGTARRFLRYAALALRGRVIVLDERMVASRDGIVVVRLTIAPLPFPAVPPDAAAMPRDGIAEQSPTPIGPRYSSLIL